MPWFASRNSETHEGWSSIKAQSKGWKCSLANNLQSTPVYRTFLSFHGTGDPPLIQKLLAETSTRYMHSAALQSQQSASVARSDQSTSVAEGRECLMRCCKRDRGKTCYRYVFEMSSKDNKTPDATVEAVLKKSAKFSHRNPHTTSLLQSSQLNFFGAL